MRRSINATRARTLAQSFLAAAFAASAAWATVVSAADLGGAGYAPVQDAPAEPHRTFYIGARGGLAYMDGTDFQFKGFGVANHYQSPGYTVGGFAGMDLAPLLHFHGLRGEVEFGQRSVDIDSHLVTGLGRFSGAQAFGRSSATFGFASLYWDIPLYHYPHQISAQSHDWIERIKPFVGAGGGFANATFSRYGVTPTGAILDGSDTAYAYHLTAGLGIDVGHGIDIELGYRRFGTGNLRVKATDGTVNDLVVDDNQLFAGIRKTF